jgi:hypothetical protein
MALGEPRREPAADADAAPGTLRHFFEMVHPGRSVLVKDIVKLEEGYFRFQLPWLKLHCDSPVCGGNRAFSTADRPALVPHKSNLVFVVYRCRNCLIGLKTYACSVTLEGEDDNGEVFKFGEVPHFGPPTPGRLVSLIGPERDYFLKGRRSESQGLGIAAFAYYRRVVENQKNRILDEIIKVTEKLSASFDVLADLRAAKNETQFTKSIDAITHGIPQVLLINGHNPLRLLHSALSEGLHEQTEEHCLELATSIRIVLTELAERLGTALKEETELNAAVMRLLNTETGKGP